MDLSEYNPEINHFDFSGKLPDDLGSLLRLSLNDLIELVGNTDYKIDVVEWHRPIYYNGNFQFCEVCLAGSVLANTLEIDKELNFYHCVFDTETERKLLAIELCRAGEICNAVATFYGENFWKKRGYFNEIYKLERGYQLIDLEYDFEKFMFQMGYLANQFKKMEV